MIYCIHPFISKNSTDLHISFARPPGNKLNYCLLEKANKLFEERTIEDNCIYRLKWATLYIP